MWVKGCQSVYALGDCATFDQRKIMWLHTRLSHFTAIKSWFSHFPPFTRKSNKRIRFLHFSLSCLFLLSVANYTQRLGVVRKGKVRVFDFVGRECACWGLRYKRAFVAEEGVVPF